MNPGLGFWFSLPSLDLGLKMIVSHQSWSFKLRFKARVRVAKWGFWSSERVSHQEIRNLRHRWGGLNLSFNTGLFHPISIPYLVMEFIFFFFFWWLCCFADIPDDEAQYWTRKLDRINNMNMDEKDVSSLRFPFAAFCWHLQANTAHDMLPWIWNVPFFFIYLFFCLSIRRLTTPSTGDGWRPRPRSAVSSKRPTSFIRNNSYALTGHFIRYAAAWTPVQFLLVLSVNLFLSERLHCFHVYVGAWWLF